MLEAQFQNSKIEEEMSQIKNKLKYMNDGASANSQHLHHPTPPDYQSISNSNGGPQNNEFDLTKTPAQVQSFFQTQEQTQLEEEFKVLQRKYNQAKKVIANLKQDYLKSFELQRQNHYLTNRIAKLEEELVSAQKTAGLPIKIPEVDQDENLMMEEAAANENGTKSQRIFSKLEVSLDIYLLR